MSSNNRELVEKERKYDSIDEMFDQEVTLDTDISDFLLITGFNYWLSPTYEKASDETKNHIRDRFEEIKNKHSREENRLESRFWKVLLNARMYEGNTTLGDFKKVIENRGIVFRNMGYKSFAHFNKTLQKYGIEPFKAGGRYSHEKTLSKYGIEVAKKE
jgi:hypothetical protein